MHVTNLKKKKKKVIKLLLFSEFRLTTVAHPALWLFINIGNINVFQLFCY